MWWLIRSVLMWGVGSGVIVAIFDLPLAILATISGLTLLVTFIWIITGRGRHMTIGQIGFLMIFPAVVGINGGMLMGYILN